MRRYLVVANQTLGGRRLEEEIRSCLAAGPCSFHIVVPATPPHESWLWVEGEAHSLAAERLGQALERFGELGAEATGEVGDPKPLEAVQDVFVRGEAFDEILLSTFPPGRSRWLKLDLPHRLESTFGLPVRHVIGAREHVG
jgi:hypothetical protein